jgi:serine/threonine protein kinase
MGDSPVPEKVGKYKFIKAIGFGAFATVYKAQHEVTLSVVAIKTIPKSKIRTMAEFEVLQREVNLLKLMDHPFIAPLFEVLDDRQNFYFVIELVENGNLLDFINGHRGLDETDARQIYFQLVSVLDYLHRERRIIHRDLKAENVLLDQHYNIRVVDFGLSNYFSEQNPFLQTTCGSPAYVSPEIIRDEPYTAAADVWASGVLLYAMVCRTFPFHGENIAGLLNSILSSIPTLPHSISPELRGLIGRLLMKESKTRITIRQIMEHPWLGDMGSPSNMARLKVQDPNELNASVLAEMRTMGYEMGGLLEDIRGYVFDERAAAYRMLRRRQMVDEINALVDQQVKPMSQAISQDRLPPLQPEGAIPRRTSDIALPPPKLPSLKFHRNVRKRTMPRNEEAGLARLGRS